MHEIDKEKFGAFVMQLRKEKGLMQKDLAQRLFVSDKAVSKWERGLSIPDVSLLVPLAEILNVTVTELLECRWIAKEETIASRQTEELVKKVICLSDEEQNVTPNRGMRVILLLLSVLAACMEIMLLLKMGHDWSDIWHSLSIAMVLMTGFGVYFCLFAKDSVPRYYDENRISAYYDGPFRFNLPGLYVNNSNLRHIMGAGRIWSLLGLVLCPILYYLIQKLIPGLAIYSDKIIAMVAVIGLVAPMYILGKKYE